MSRSRWSVASSCTRTAVATLALLAWSTGCEPPKNPGAAWLGLSAPEQLAAEYGADVEPGAVERVIEVSKPSVRGDNFFDEKRIGTKGVI